MTTVRPTDLFPPTEPYHHGFLPSVAGHAVYFEECGHPDGLPVVFLHGGPGSGCGPKHRQLFNPRTTRVVLFDQRGCGRSTADKPLQANTTTDLLHDMERLREHLGIKRWLVVGGSWGGGLGLAYASTYPSKCLGSVIRGVFLSRPADLQWFFDQMLNAHDQDALPLAIAWQAWENALTQRSVSSTHATAMNEKEAKALIAKYRLQSHYLINQCFFPSTGLLAQLAALNEMPVTLVHGRLDWICRPESAWAVHQAIQHSQLIWVDNAGHNPFEQPMTGVLVKAIEDLVQKLCT
ncbi:MAG: alpha/beta fold hydrolase [Betaproteobacteria bacterium]|nr:alpha/beta fold hydrolase [Betaproteobacteria bacterium]